MSFNGLDAGSSDENLFRNNFPLHRACRDGDVHDTNVILNSNSQIAVVEDPFRSWTALHWAAHYGQLDCVRLLVCKVPNIANIQSSKTFQTPLHCAAEAGHYRCVFLLLQARANPNVKDISGETALHKAARVGTRECVNVLVHSSSNVSVSNNIGQSASVLAEVNGHMVIAAFIKRNEDLSVNMDDMNGFQPSLRRKRNWGMVPQIIKRQRSEDISESVEDMFGINSSVIEHDKLCRMEYGYTNSLFECMFSEFHGC